MCSKVKEGRKPEVNLDLDLRERFSLGRLHSTIFSPKKYQTMEPAPISYSPEEFLMTISACSSCEAVQARAKDFDNGDVRGF